MIIAVNSALATDYEYEHKLEILRNEKNAKVKVIDLKIKNVTQNIEQTIANNKLSESEKDKKLAVYQKDLETLNNQKSDINRQYRIDKKKLKSKK